jgi:uroporphyrinogen III methyltransferase / synthase
VRILLTGTRAEPLRGRLEALGHEVLHRPLIRVESLGDGSVGVDGYDWVVVTSVTGAEELRRRMRGRPARLAAVGPATAEALGGADLVPGVSTQEGLLAELPRPAGRVLFAGAEGARRLLVDELGADFVALYRTVELRCELPDADVAVLQSSSAARALAAVRTDIPALSIGPQTTRTARAAGVRILAEARTHDVEGLVEACSSLS